MKVPKQIIRYFLFLLVGVGGFLFGCRKVIDLPLRTSDIRLVIESNISNLDSVQYVRLTLTKKYFSTNVFEGVRGAFVELTEVKKDGSRVIDTLTVTDKDGECTGCFGGYYRSNRIKQCTPGATYFLKVQYDGKTHTAQTRMQEVVNIDTLIYRFKEADPPFVEKGYYITMFGKEPDTLGNNYRIKVFKNDTLYIGEGVPDYLVNDDRFFNGVYIANELAYKFDENDTARVELISIEPIMLRYYQTLARQVFAGGNPFAPPGDNIVTNIKGDPAFGFFGSFAISRKEVIIRKQ